MEQDIGHIKKGDVVYVPFPLDEVDTYEQNPNNDGALSNEETALQIRRGDPRKKKDRPTVVLWQTQTDSFTVCAITSNSYREHKIELSGRDLDSGKISYEPSYIRPDIITTVHRKFIRKKVGTLKSEKLKEVINKVKELLDAEPEEAPVAKAFKRPRRGAR